MARVINEIVDGIAFGEAPRWHDDALYIADIHADRVLRLGQQGGYDVVASFSGPVSGVGWLPDGRMLVVSMVDRRVLRIEPDGSVVVHADLSEIATWHANDMIVLRDGSAFVGNFGFCLYPPSMPRTAALARVSPSGDATIAAEGLWFPNGMVITPDESTLIVAESGTRQLTAFDLNSNGGLSGRRLWAALPDGALPDGICLDAEGAIWVASPPSREVLRVRQDGEVVERIALEQQAFACMLGGIDRTTLFVTTADDDNPDARRAARTAKVLAIRVDVPGAGLP